MEPVKEVVSVSIGSSTRDHEVEIELLGQQFRLRREGTDGDLARAKERFEELDGRVAALGMGGIDLFLRVAGRDYYFRDGGRLVRNVRETPVVCGSGLKGALEASTVHYMREELGLNLQDKKLLITSAVDRYGMAEAFYRAGCDMTYGDLLYVLDIPVMIHSWKQFKLLARTIAPIAVRLPFKWLYPTGHEQEKTSESGHEHLYHEADIIAGDFQYVRKYMPQDMAGKWVVTNTTTPDDVEDLRRRGIELLVTSTPRLEGRSFGTNVIEATMVALKGASSPLAEDEYIKLLKEVGFVPDVRWLQRGK